MSDGIQDEMERVAAASIGSLLAKKRWAKATPADRKRQGKLMAAGRKRKAAKRGKK